jgi:DNA-binding beta-propeller fold protein YncE
MNSVKVFAFSVLITFLLSALTNAQWSFDTAVTAGTNPTGIAITSDGSKLVVTNNTKPGNVEIISTSDYSISNIDISSIEDYPNAVTVAPNDSIAIVNTLHKTIFINLYTHAIKNTITAPCASTTLYGIALTPDGKTIVYPDLSSGCKQQGIRLGDATGVSSNTSFIQVNTSGVLTGVAVTPDGSSALVTTFTSDSPKLVNLQTLNIQNIAGISSGSYGLAMFHNSNEALIYDGDSLYRVSLTTNSVTKTISYLSYNTNFQNIAITKDDKYAFVVGAFEKLVISLDNNSVIENFTAGGTNVAVNSNGSEFYVTDSYNGTVRVYKEQNPSAVKEMHRNVPGIFQLYQNYPNPFNPATVISYQVNTESYVTLKVYDELGKEVANLVDEKKQPGKYEIDFNAENLPSGVYFYRIKVKPVGNNNHEIIQASKMLLLK